jgi:hypothetical protein
LVIYINMGHAKSASGVLKHAKKENKK